MWNNQFESINFQWIHEFISMTQTNWSVRSNSIIEIARKSKEHNSIAAAHSGRNGLNSVKLYMRFSIFEKSVFGVWGFKMPRNFSIHWHIRYSVNERINELVLLLLYILLWILIISLRFVKCIAELCGQYRCCFDSRWNFIRFGAEKQLLFRNEWLRILEMFAIQTPGYEMAIKNLKSPFYAWMLDQQQWNDFRHFSKRIIYWMERFVLMILWVIRQNQRRYMHKLLFLFYFQFET